MHDRSDRWLAMPARNRIRAVAPVLLAAVMSCYGGCAGRDEGVSPQPKESASAPAEATVERIPTSVPTEPSGMLAVATEAAPRTSPDAAATDAPAASAMRRWFDGWIPSSLSNSPASSATPTSSSTDSTTSTRSRRKPAKPAGPSLDERLLFFPTKYDPAGDWQPLGLKYEDASFTSADGTRLHGWYCPSDEPTAVILYCHGNAGNISYDAPLFRLLQTQLRATVFGFDYRGYGKSEGRATAAGVTADARAARAWLAKRAGVPETQVVLMGRSLGGAVAVQLTTDVRPRGLILESTFDSLRAMAAHHYKLMAGLVPAGKFDSAAALAGYDGPLLQSHGDEDRTIPFASGEALFLTAKGRKEFFPIPGADHNDPQPAAYYDKLMRFITELP
jgi:fermentation-respiration switch protein FrsA (DUF1100 family)